MESTPNDRPEDSLLIGPLPIGPIIESLIDGPIVGPIPPRAGKPETKPPNGIPPDIPLGILPGIPLGIPPDIPRGIPPDIPLGIPPDIPRGIPPDIPLGIPPDIPLGIPPDIPLGMPLAIPEGIIAPLIGTLEKKDDIHRENNSI
jgi:hypothetical protein